MDRQIAPRFADKYILKKGLSAFFKDYNSSLKLDVIVVIPCKNESHLFLTLESILQAKTLANVLVISVINHSEADNLEIKNQNQNTLKQSESFISTKTNIEFVFVKAFDIPKKLAGVGYARKIGLDNAVNIFNKQNNSEGIIASLDADSTIKQNYFDEIISYYKKNPKQEACSIYFEHCTDKNKHSQNNIDAISWYELYLRYYLHALRFIGYTNFYHTVGSSFALKAWAYVKYGGMNQKQAGEDFYFLQMIIPNKKFGEINTTAIYPSPRESNRVPFGTGPAVLDYISNNKNKIETYTLKSFFDLGEFFKIDNKFFRISEPNYLELINRLPKSVKGFLIENKFYDVLTVINKNSTNERTFLNAFYIWFSAFRILKFLNFAHENIYTRTTVLDSAIELLLLMDKEITNTDIYTILDVYRKMEKEF